MNDVIQFIQNHWLLNSALLAVVMVLTFLELMKLKRAATRVSPTRATQLMNHDSAVIVDVRSTDAFNAGHIIEAMSIPLKELEDKIKKLQKVKSQPIILVDAAGTDSQKAASVLQQQGFTAYVLQGGLRAWQDANMPLVKE